VSCAARSAGAALRHGAGAAALLLAGCVTVYEDQPLFGKKVPPPDFAVPVTIPFPTNEQLGGSATAAAFYRGMIDRLHEAVRQRDPEEIEARVALLDRPDLPAPIAEHVRGYRAIARGLRFCRHAAERATLQVVPPPADAQVPVEQGVAALGAPLQLELGLPAPADGVRLGGEREDEPIGFAVAITVDDRFVDGSSASVSTQKFVWLPEPVELRGAEVLRLPIAVELPGDNAVRRDVLVRVDLMPGYVRTDLGRAPVARTGIGAASASQWPVGYGAIAASPLQELRAALRAFGPKTFPRAYLAAAATTGPDRETAIELLVEQVRFGRPDQAQVAMAALRAADAAELPIGDREAWLAWWNQRR
jgi:hypothetical protein